MYVYNRCMYYTYINLARVPAIHWAVSTHPWVLGVLGPPDQLMWSDIGGHHPGSPVGVGVLPGRQKDPLGLGVVTSFSLQNHGRIDGNWWKFMEIHGNMEWWSWYFRWFRVFGMIKTSPMDPNTCWEGYLATQIIAQVLPQKVRLDLWLAKCPNRDFTFTMIVYTDGLPNSKHFKNK